MPRLTISIRRLVIILNLANSIGIQLDTWIGIPQGCSTVMTPRLMTLSHSVKDRALKASWGWHTPQDYDAS